MESVYIGLLTVILGAGTGFLVQKYIYSKLKQKYSFVILLNSILVLCIYIMKGIQLESILFFLCIPVLIAVGVIDAKQFEIPFACTVAVSVLGVARVLTDLSHWYQYLGGFVIVSGMFLLVYILTRGKGIGGGDIKLMAAAGLLLGFADVLLALFIASVAGAVIHLLLMRFQNKDRVLAFGPYLSAGIYLAMLLGDKIIPWYLAFFS